MVTASEFRTKLAEQISSEEGAALRSGGLCINDFNRSVCLRLLDQAPPDDGPVSPADTEELRSDLEAYLNEYMQDKPEGPVPEWLAASRSCHQNMNSSHAWLCFVPHWIPV